AQLGGGGVRYRDRGLAAGEGKAHRQPAAHAFGVVATAVHRDDVRDGRGARRAGAVDGHRELVAVRQRDVPTAKGIRDVARTARRERRVQLVILDVDGGALQLAREPWVSALGQEYRDGATVATLFTREFRH